MSTHQILDIPVETTKSFDLLDRSRLAIIAVIVAAASIRLWGAFSDLPYIYHPDEPRYISIMQGIFKTGDLNPHFFNYPSMFLYVNALAYLPYYLLGKLAGAFASPNDILAPNTLVMGTTFTQIPTSVILSRSVTILFGTAAVALVFCIGRRLANNTRVGLLAALMMAISPGSVANSRSITPDTYMLFWALATLLAATLIFQQGKTRYYILAGLSAGFTSSSKYNGALIMVCVIAAHVLRYGWRGFRDYRLYLAALLSIAGFILITPFAVLDYHSFLRDLTFEAQHYSTGHAGMEGNALAWYGSYVWGIEGFASVLALAQMIRGLYLRSKPTVLLSAFVLVYLAFISSYVVRNDRTILPVMPFMFLLSAMLAVDLFEARFFDSALPRAIVRALAFIVVFSALATPLWNTVHTAIQLSTVDSRTTVRLWANSNLPKGAHIAIESYAPFVDPARFAIQGVGRMIDNPPDWYIDNRFDYLIFSQGMYGRFYKEPDKYPREVALYNALFGRFNLLYARNDGDWEIRVYQVKK